MGCYICCCACPVAGQTADSAQLQPLLFDLERNLDDLSKDHHLSLNELIDLWKSSAKKKAGTLTLQEEQLIEVTARDKFAEIDTDSSGTVSYAEFVTFSMDGLSADGPLRSFRKNLNLELKKDPGKLATFITKFKLWDKNGDGFVTVDELDEYIAEIATLPKERSFASLCSCSPGRKNDAPGVLAKQLKAEMPFVDLDNNGKVDLWEITGWALGRRRTPVELLLYDISKGAAKWLGPIMLARTDVEAFHSAVLVFGSEYWYGGKIFRTSPPCTEQFGEPLRSSRSKELKFEKSEAEPELMVVRLGYTFVTHEEFVAFLREKLMDRYTGVEKYDLLTQSCNHFSDEILHFLLGHGLPPHVLELQRIALTPMVKAMRPFLNRYLGGFSGETGGGDPLMTDAVVVHDSSAGLVEPNHVLGEGEVVILDGVPGLAHHVPATIVAEHSTVCDVRFYDPNTAKIVVKKNVPTKLIKQRVSQPGGTPKK